MLDYWLSQCYQASVLKGDGKDTLAIFKERVNADQNLKKEAQQRVPQLESVNRIGDRCFVSKKQLEFLREVLN